MATKKLQKISRKKESDEFEWSDEELELLLDTLLIYKESMERNGINWEHVKEKYATIHRLFILNLQCNPNLCNDVAKRTRVISKAKIKISVRALRQGYQQTLQGGGMNGKNLSTFLVKCKEIWGDCLNKERSPLQLGDKSLESLLSVNSNEDYEISSSVRNSVRKKKGAYERSSLPCLRDNESSLSSNDSGISLDSNEDSQNTKKVSRTPSISNIKRTLSHRSDLSKPLSPHEFTKALSQQSILSKPLSPRELTKALSQQSVLSKPISPRELTKALSQQSDLSKPLSSRELTTVLETQQNNIMKDEIVQKIEEMHLNHTKAMNCLQEKFENFAEIIQDMLELRSSNPKNFNQHYYNIAFLEDMVTKSSQMACTVQNELTSSIAALDPSYESLSADCQIPNNDNDSLESNTEQLSFDDSYAFDDDVKSIHSTSEIIIDDNFSLTKLNALKECSIESLCQKPRSRSYDLANYQPYDPLKQYLHPGESLLDK